MCSAVHIRPTILCSSLSNICIVSYQIYTRVLIFNFQLYSHNSDLTLCSSSITKTSPCQFWKYFVHESKSVFRPRSQWPFILAYRISEWFQSPTNVVTKHPFQEFRRVLEANLQPTRSSYSSWKRDQILVQLPQQQIEYKSHLEMFSLVAAPPSHWRSDDSTCQEMHRFQTSQYKAYWSIEAVKLSQTYGMI